MSGLFHDKVPLEYIEKTFSIIEKTFSIMAQAMQHTFQVLTKRAERLAELSAELTWPTNVWMGVSVESERNVDRIDHLRSTGAAIKFLSLEPLLGPLPKLDLGGIDWLIVGGESGPNARPVDPAWVTDIRDQCVRSGVPFFFKQ